MVRCLLNYSEAMGVVIIVVVVVVVSSGGGGGCGCSGNGRLGSVNKSL